MSEHSGEIASAPKGFHLAACKRSWKAGAPADEGCHPDCPRRLWAEVQELRVELGEAEHQIATCDQAVLRVENERLREALRAAGLAPNVVDAIAEGEPPRPCPAGHGDQCCGYPAACEAALTGRKEDDRA